MNNHNLYGIWFNRQIHTAIYHTTITTYTCHAHPAEDKCPGSKDSDGIKDTAYGGGVWGKVMWKEVRLSSDLYMHIYIYVYIYVYIYIY